MKRMWEKDAGLQVQWDLPPFLQEEPADDAADDAVNRAEDSGAQTTQSGAPRLLDTEQRADAEQPADTERPADLPRARARRPRAQMHVRPRTQPKNRATAQHQRAGEEQLVLVQVLLCALMVAFVLFARSADVPFLADLKSEYRRMLSTGVEFSTDNTFARFANGVVDDLRVGAENLLEQLETPPASGGQGGYWPIGQRREAPEGATFDSYTLPQELLLPVAGVVTSGYGFRDNPVNGEDDFHAGVDIAAAEGTPVAAAQAGQVVCTGYNALRGYYAIVRHAGGVQTLYQHLSYIFVRGGETVRQGQTIAAVGSTGLVTGPHLHLELIVDGVRVDPLPAWPQLDA